MNFDLGDIYETSKHVMERWSKEVEKRDCEIARQAVEITRLRDYADPVGVWRDDIAQLTDTITHLQSQYTASQEALTEMLTEHRKVCEALELIEAGPPNAMFDSHFDIIEWMQGIARAALHTEASLDPTPDEEK